ncbi:MAG: M20/M25/M40 family metallo-hydrolase [Candidatus Eremiobacteraeota bacterium]|nr:M20/M25/M40 family metallo-hydrolase [Candidatus Eremiobacteraeota bacterium]
MTTEHKLHSRIEQRAADYLEWLRELVSCPSPTGQEAACQKLVEERMRDLGLQPQAVFGSNQPPFHDTGRDYSGRPNLVGRLPGSGRGRVMLNAHVDTAPVTDPEAWTHPPHGAVVVGDKLYGRGALDDKAGLAMMLLLAEVFQDFAQAPELLFASVIEDEDSGNGSLACMEAGFWTDYAIVLDGTWPFRAIDSHLGQLWLHLEVPGVAAPSCSWARAVNPIDLAFQRITALRAWVDEQNRRTPTWLEISNPFFLSIGEFHSGSWAGSVPERAHVSLQLGFPPPWTPESIAEVAREHLGDFRIGALCTPPHSQRPNRPAELLRANVDRLRAGEREFRIQAVTGHCDLRNLRKADGSPAEACLYGPGGGANPHVADEYYHMSHFVPVAQNVASALLELVQV